MRNSGAAALLVLLAGCSEAEKTEAFDPPDPRKAALTLECKGSEIIQPENQPADNAVERVNTYRFDAPRKVFSIWNGREFRDVSDGELSFEVDDDHVTFSQFYRKNEDEVLQRTVGFDRATGKVRDDINDEGVRRAAFDGDCTAVPEPTARHKF